MTTPVLGKDPTWYPFRIRKCGSLCSLWVAFDEKVYEENFKANPFLALMPVLKSSSQTLQFLTGIPQFEGFLLSPPRLEHILFVADRSRQGHRRMAENPGLVHPTQKAWFIKCFPQLESQEFLQILSSSNSVSLFQLIDHALSRFTYSFCSSF